MLISIVLLSMIFLALMLALRETPRDLTSLYRYKLWALRDQMVDDHRAGKVTFSPVFKKALQEVESNIVVAPFVRPFFVIVGGIGVALFVKRSKETDNPDSRVFEELPVAERMAIAQYKARMNQLLVKHFFLGSLGGLLLLIPISIFVLLVTIWLLFRRFARRMLPVGSSEKRNDISQTKVIAIAKSNRRYLVRSQWEGFAAEVIAAVAIGISSYGVHCAPD